MSNLVDLTGQRFNKLKVLKRAPVPEGKKSREAWWLCQCDCGNEVVVRGSSLRKGETGSCGCLHKEIVAKTHIKDLVGQRFGKLTVIERNSSDKNGHATWWCHCDCGSIISVLGTNLLKQNTQSCGCINSYGEEVIAKILSSQNLSFEREFSFNDLLGDSGFPLRFDFKIDNILIEFQGRQHYEAESFYGGIKGLQLQQKYDNMKRQYCKEHGLILIEIPYYDIDKINYLYLKEKIDNGKKNN